MFPDSADVRKALGYGQVYLKVNVDVLILMD